mmetsp:Transcript_39423/g.59257  ORF Transcript_39423/g.59257 Transcript_39423/m.59257 type:complete len:84 (-) Transcript_39423:142-393(-)
MQLQVSSLFDFSLVVVEDKSLQRNILSHVKMAEILQRCFLFTYQSPQRTSWQIGRTNCHHKYVFNLTSPHCMYGKREKVKNCF